MQSSDYVKITSTSFVFYKTLAYSSSLYRTKFAPKCIYCGSIFFKIKSFTTVKYGQQWTITQICRASKEGLRSMEYVSIFKQLKDLTVTSLYNYEVLCYSSKYNIYSTRNLNSHHYDTRKMISMYHFVTHHSLKRV